VEYKTWLNNFRKYLSEYGSNPSETDNIILAMDSEIKIAHERDADPEIACIRIGKAFFKAKKDAEAKEIFEKYSAHPPRIYSIKHCLNVYFTRMEIRNPFTEYLKTESEKENTETCTDEMKLKFHEENPVYHPDINNKVRRCSPLIQILSGHLGVICRKILVVSICRSKYSVLEKLISFKSQIPLATLKAGIPSEGVQYQYLWDDFTEAMNSISNTELFFMEQPEPFEFKEFLAQLSMAQRKHEFSVILILGYTYLLNSEEKTLFEGCIIRQLDEFSEKYSVGLSVFP